MVFGIVKALDLQINTSGLSHGLLVKLVGQQMIHNIINSCFFQSLFYQKLHKEGIISGLVLKDKKGLYVSLHVILG